MTTKKEGGLLLGALLLIAMVFLLFKYCGSKKTYTQKEVDKILSEQAATKAEYEDSLDFVRGQLDLQGSANTAHTERIVELERIIDSLYNKHQITKTKIKPFPTADSNYAMLVPNEYVDECETCFNKLRTYKGENVQLRFERDSYDSLMRQQSEIQSDRIQALEFEKIKLSIAQSQNTKCDTTRKLKIGISGMANNLFIPKGGGFCLVYEDKKFNEFGGHVIFTSSGNIYLLHLAKTISFKRKR